MKPKKKMPKLAKNELSSGIKSLVPGSCVRFVGAFDATKCKRLIYDFQHIPLKVKVFCSGIRMIF